MWKKSLILAIVAGLFALLVSLAYMSVYKQLADFSEKASVTNLLGFSLFFCFIASIILIVFDLAIKNKSIAHFATGLIVAGLAIASVFYVLKMDDPTFKNEDAELMKDYFKGFIMPILFFPALSWFTFKNLLIK
jgi:membrane protease YdiL (CAAX protease family)